ncbi:ankyrin repeat-containing domain protein [Apiospora arundinis]|uniref:Ankyrin repeat-containing domain protein n=1 Tax=Apiospora arundinis TaxID=335852 RepID=A0ABR2JC87_9PEZI
MSSQRPKAVEVSDNVDDLQEDVTPSGKRISACFGLEWSDDFWVAGKYDVILIHGVRDVLGDVWNKGDRNWVKSEVFAKEPFNIAEFRYDNCSHDASIFSVNGIEKEAMKLLEGLTKKPNHQDGPFIGPSIDRDLLFITRDIGGLIAKKALCIASRSPKTCNDIVRRTSLMIFYNCPHRSFDLEDVEDNVLRLLGSPGPTGIHGVAQKAKRLAAEIERIHQDCSHALLWQQIPVQNFITLWGKPETQVCKRFPKSRFPIFLIV